MKKIKKILSVFTVFALALSMCIVAKAADPTPTTVTVSINDDLNNHTYEVYTILTGTQVTGDTTGALADVKWAVIDATAGTNVGTAIIDALKADTTVIERNADDTADVTLASLFPEGTTAADFATTMSGQADNSKVAKAVAKKLYSIKDSLGTAQTIDDTHTSINVLPGYYLILDVTDLTDVKDDANNAAILQVTGKGNLEITNKTTKPTIDKKVEENRHRADANGKKWSETADYCVGETIPFKITATIPDVSKFDTYEAVITDTLDAGLDLPAQANVAVSINDTPVNTYQTGDGVSVDSTNRKVIVTLTDVKKYVGADATEVTIVVTYNSALNKNANFTRKGNENTVNLTYSNNPSTDGTGVTTDEQVVVYSMGIKINKVDDTAEKNQLTNAEFKLEKEEKFAIIEGGVITGWAENIDGGSVITVNGPTAVKGLEQGTYKLHEIKAPAGYETPADPFVVEITSEIGAQNIDYDGATSQFKSMSVTADGTNASVTLSADDTEAVAAVTITNTKGGTLPETGGMGTTLFYIIGGLLVVGAGVVLVSKKRLESK